jgi:hypothetical protein
MTVIVTFGQPCIEKRQSDSPRDAGASSKQQQRKGAEDAEVSWEKGKFIICCFAGRRAAWANRRRQLPILFLPASSASLLLLPLFLFLSSLDPQIVCSTVFQAGYRCLACVVLRLFVSCRKRDHAASTTDQPQSARPCPSWANSISLPPGCDSWL